MNKLLQYALLFIIVAFGFQNCTDYDDAISVPPELKVQSFIWKGLNLYYLWKSDVPDLADSKFKYQPQLNDYLYTKGTAEELFQDLLYKPVSKFPSPGEAVDRFSILVKDYSYLENLFKGVATSNGMEYGLKFKTGSETDIFGYVQYILPNSDAAGKNIKRGDIFYAVNGIPLTTDNYRSLLQNQNYTLNLADYNNGNITPNGISVELNKSQLSENPILVNKIMEIGNHKVAYLSYNSFLSNYDNELNAAFGKFKAEGATDLVLDLRYNSGGAVQTAVYLASMITGQFDGQLLGKEQWNPKVQKYFEDNAPKNLNNYFTNSIKNGAAINSLNLSKVYILTSKGTASASELIINCLKPYINVTQIGDVTTGKNAGSITLYDSPDFSSKNRNPNHRYAMQPLVFKLVNKAGFGDYQNGLEPTIILKEDIANLGQLGDVNEPLLSTALGIISSNGRMIRHTSGKAFREFGNSKSIRLFGTDMYKSTPEDLEELIKQFQ